MAARGSAQGRTTALERAFVAGRVVLAAGGSYGVAALATALLSLTLPMAMGGSAP